MTEKSGRNALCLCGSGKKYKHCCLSKVSVSAHAHAHPQQIASALRRGLVYLQAGHFPQAITVFKQILALAPNQPDALHLLGTIALREGRVEQAVDLISRALKHHQNNPEYYNNFGFALHERGRLDEALKHYRHALALAPNYGNAYFNMHALLLQNVPEALACLDKVVTFTPGDEEAQWMLAVLLERDDRAESAQKILDQLLRLGGLSAARVDAWNTLKQHGGLQLPMMGSMLQTFQHCLSKAPHEGLVLEFGVRFGNTIRQIAELVGPRQAVHGFDSFEGLPEAWHKEAKGSYSTKGEIPDVPKHVRLHQGWFENTLPTFLEQHPGNVRFINIDCDIYSSTKTVLDLLAPRIAPGAVIVFDEYIGNEQWREDEFKAFQEAVVRYGWEYEYLCFSLFTKQVAVRIK